MLFILGRRFFSLTRGKLLKRAESHRCEVNTLAKLARNFSTFVKVSPRHFFKSLAESERSDRFSEEEF